MTWLHADPAAASPLEAVLGLRPDLLAQFRAFSGEAWRGTALPPRLLALCRARVAALHGCEDEGATRRRDDGVDQDDLAALDGWPDADRFSSLERAALAVAEKMPWQHHEITDAEIAALRDGLGDAGVVGIVVAIALFDATCRLGIALGIAPESAHLDGPAKPDDAFA